MGKGGKRWMGTRDPEGKMPLEFGGGKDPAKGRMAFGRGRGGKTLFFKTDPRVLAPRRKETSDQLVTHKKIRTFPCNFAGRKGGGGRKRNQMRIAPQKKDSLNTAVEIIQGKKGKRKKKIRSRP